MTTITLSRERHGFLADCLADRAMPVARSSRFSIYAVDPERPNGAPVPDPDDIILVHDFHPGEIDNNIGHFVAEELLPLICAAPRPDPASEEGAQAQAVFERFVGEIVRSMDSSERRAWHLFYDNTLTAMHRLGRDAAAVNGGPPAPQDFISDFAAIYSRVGALVAETAPETVLDVATCFGFLPLLLAQQGPEGGVEARAPSTAHWSAGGPPPDRPYRRGAKAPTRIVAFDLNPALVALAADYAEARSLTGVRFVQADLLAAGLAHTLANGGGPTSFDVVMAIHLLEHLEPSETIAALDALWALTGRRLILAVPIEAEPDARFGHRQVFDQRSLAALGPRTGGTCRCFEDHGAWLVIDRHPARDTNRPSRSRPQRTRTA